MITELTLRLHGLPEHAIAVRAAFPSLDAACRAATAIVGGGRRPPARVELLDAETIGAVNAYKGTDYAEAPSLFVELAGSEAGVAGDLEAVREIAAWEGCTELEQRARGGGAQHASGRHGTTSSSPLQAASPGKLHKSTDVCVPLSQLAPRRSRTRARSTDELGLRGDDRGARGRRQLPRPLHARSRRPARSSRRRSG